FEPKREDYVTSEYFQAENFTSLATVLLRHIEQMGGSSDVLEADAIKEALNAVGKETGTKGKPLFMTLRVASTGRLEGLELPVYLGLLGKARVIERITKMIALKNQA
ncbi:MAG TPA: glutamate--tRNA ligase, partial [Turneriella sp.]|nr:glutamate--tRNA ligase [Turneriella sp.]